MKKKLLSLILVAAMVMGLSMTAMAAGTTFDSRTNPTDENQPPYTDTGVVTIKMNPEESADVYYVVVDWDELSFSYDFGNAAVWNPETHKYTGEGVGAGWTHTSAKKITVTNHSNRGINVSATMDNVSKYDVTTSLSPASFSLPSGEGLDPTDSSLSSAFIVNVSGVPNKVVESFDVGTITVTISK